MTDPTNPTPDERRDMLDLRQQAQSWIDNLQIAGMSEAAIVSAIQLSLIERSLVRGGLDQTLAWMRGWVALVEKGGADLLAELRKQGH